MVSGSPKVRTLAPLPEVGDQGVPGVRFVDGAMGASLGILVILFVLAVVASLFVTVSTSVDSEGFLEADSSWTVRAFESGLVEEVLVRVGDTVHENQVVVILDSAQSVAQVIELQEQLEELNYQVERFRANASVSRERSSAINAQARASVQRAEAGLRERMADFGVFGSPDSVARASTSRVHVAFDTRSADLASATAAMALAEADSLSTNLQLMDIEALQSRIRRVKSQVSLARKRLGRHQIRAPATGVVLTDGLERLRGAAVTAGAPIMEVARTDAWHIRITIPEREVPGVHVGDRVLVEIPAVSRLLGGRLDGRIRFVGWQPLSDNQDTFPVGGRGAGGYQALVGFDSLSLARLEPGLVRQGQLVHAKILTRRGRIFSIVRDYARALVAASSR